MKNIQLRLAWSADLSRSEWDKNPVYRDVPAVALSDVWAVHRENESDFWTLTHRPTGFAAGHGFDKIVDARKCAAALTAKFGREAWKFTDPEIASSFDGAKAIISAFGGWS